MIGPAGDREPPRAQPPRPAPDPPAPTSRWQRGIEGLLLALTFLTVLPLGRLIRTPAASDEPAAMGPALPWFPVVGAMLGGVLALVDWALAPVLALPVRDALLLALAALGTGMLHLDGFVDCCDALLGVRSVSRRLEIMRDSRVGAYGTIGVCLLLLARFAALGALGSPVRVFALVVAPLLGRWSMVYAVARYPYARSAGTGTPFQTPRRAGYLALATLAAALALLAACTTIGGAPVGLRLALAGLLALVALAVTVGWSWWASRRLGGGLTGDTYGALNELVELAVLSLTPPLALLLTLVR